MPLPKLNLIPSRDGYAFADDPGEVLRAKVSAGPSFQRLDMIGGPAEVNVSLRLTDAEYEYWRAFFRTTIAKGSLPFLMDLLLDSPQLTEHTVKVIPGSVRMSGTSGSRYLVDMRLEAKMADTNIELDETLVMLFDQYGEDADNVLAALAVLVNVSLP